MELPESLINEFANVVSPRVDRTNNETVVYGTVKTVDGKTAMVQLDGSDTVTPCAMSMTAEQNDRVRVAIKDHKAVVTGNVTAPATASAADKYMRFTDEGLVIGGLDKDGKPSGFYVLISNDTYYIKDQNGATIAKFASNEVNLASGEATIKSENETLYLIGKNAVGLRSTDAQKGTAEVVVKDGSVASVQTKTNAGAISSVVCDSTTGRVDITVPSMENARVNGSSLVTVGTANAASLTGVRNVTFAAHETKQMLFKATADSYPLDVKTYTGIPTGYRITGFKDLMIVYPNTADPNPNVKLTNWVCGGTQEFDINDDFRTAIMWFTNESSSAVTVDITVGFIGMSKSAIVSGGSHYIDF